MNTSKTSTVWKSFLIGWPTLIPYSNTGYLKTKAQGPTKMRLKYFLSLQVRLRLRLKLQYFQTMMVSFCLLENGACRAGYTPNGWCNVKVGNLLSLERLKRSLVNDVPDLSLVHNYSICMDGTVAKRIFKTSCLQAPIIPTELSMRISKPFNFNVIIPFCLVVVLIVVIALLALYDVRTQKRKNTPTMSLHAKSQSHSATGTSVSTIQKDSSPRSSDSSMPLICETVEHEQGLISPPNLSTVRVWKWCQPLPSGRNCIELFRI